MIIGPKLEERVAQPYAGIRTVVAMSELPTVIPQLHSEIYGWLKKREIEPYGPPLIRYLVIDMAGKLDIELGVPVQEAINGDGRVAASVLPAGQYASLIYIGDYAELMDANRVLIEWGAKNGLVWDSSTGEDGDVFVSRFENYIVDPGNEPNDPSKWETEVAIKVKGI